MFLFIFYLIQYIYVHPFQTGGQFLYDAANHLFVGLFILRKYKSCACRMSYHLSLLQNPTLKTRFYFFKPRIRHADPLPPSVRHGSLRLHDYYDLLHGLGAWPSFPIPICH
jgi:hypothetical protein